MIPLNLPDYEIKLSGTPDKPTIFDVLRRKYIALTPEEWVRQHVVQFLLQDKKYPKSYINVEKLIKINDLSKRYDGVVFQPNGDIFLLIECKAPEVPISQQTFDQIARYNLVLKAKYLMVTNGLNHYFCQMDFENEKYVFLKELPEYSNQ